MHAPKAHPLAWPGLALLPWLCGCAVGRGQPAPVLPSAPLEPSAALVQDAFYLGLVGEPWLWLGACLGCLPALAWLWRGGGAGPRGPARLAGRLGPVALLGRLWRMRRQLQVLIMAGQARSQPGRLLPWRGRPGPRRRRP